MDFLYFALIGIAAGYIGGQIVKGKGFGLIGNLIVGVVGAILGGWITKTAGFYASSGVVPSLITAVIGAVALLFVIRLFRRL